MSRNSRLIEKIIIACIAVEAATMRVQECDNDSTPVEEQDKDTEKAWKKLNQTIEKFKGLDLCQ